MLTDLIIKKKMITVNIDNENINVPSFMVDKKFNNVDSKSIYYALTFIGKFLKKNIITTNNFNSLFSNWCQ